MADHLKKKTLQTLLGPAQGNSSLETYSEIVTDSRKITSRCLFACIPGDRFDGHSYAKEAIQKGAKAILGQKEKLIPYLDPNIDFYFVKDTTEALRTVAQSIREKFQKPVICIAGSVGKTTTKELLAHTLETFYPGKILKTLGSENGFLGIALTLLRLKPEEHEMALIEVGIDDKGAMEKHLQIVQPTAAILTAIGEEHLEKLETIETVAKEELKVFEWMNTHSSPSSFIAFNQDDEWIQKTEKKFPNIKKINFSLSQTKNLNLSETQSTFIYMKDQKEYPIQLPIPGEHQIRNSLGVIALLMGLGCDLSKSLSAFKTFKAAFGRTETELTPEGIFVLKDYYNANPSSMKAALQILTQGNASSRKYACLGDMLELGPNENQFHEELAPLLISAQIQGIFLYGKRMRFLFQKLKDLNYAGLLVHSEKHSELALKIKSCLKKNDRLLIKGSRGMKMEEVWKLIHGSSKSEQSSSSHS